MRSTSLALAAPLLVYFLGFACGGRTLAGSGGTNPGGGGGGGGGGGSSTGGGGSGGSNGLVSPGGSCVNIELSAYDTSCVQSSDCISVNVGQVCTGACLCGGGGAISASAQPEYKAALSSIRTYDTCPCPPPRPVACVEGQCTFCNFDPNDPFDCPGNDSEGGTEAETGTVIVVSEGGGPEDSGVCVDVDISTYDTSCSQDSDCIGISSGEICPRSTCFCGGSAVNVSEQSRYQAAISSIVVADEQAPPFVCACPPIGIPVCAAGRCTLCSPDLADGGCVP
jgi:hypothetical protein